MNECPDKIEPIQVICEQAETCRTNLYCFHTKPHQQGEECLTPCAYMTAPCIPEGFPMPDEKVADCDHKMRQFDTGATRNNDPDRLDFEGFICPLSLETYAKYMHKHRLQEDGELRDSDNWQKGISKTVYMKSKFRHFFMSWKLHRHPKTKAEIIESLCAELFNTFGYMHELLKES